MILLFIGAGVLPNISGNIVVVSLRNTNIDLNPPDEEWSITFGGIYDDVGHSVQQTADGGYIITGRVDSIMEWPTFVSDVYLLKTDSNGNIVWEKRFGGTPWDEGFSVQQTTDGGFIVVGETKSYGAGESDVWLIKTDNDGNEEWNKTFGSSDIDWGKSVQQTSDSGYIIVGYTNSWYELNAIADVLLIKTDSDGNEEWIKTFGGQYYDNGNFVQQTSDGGYIISGHTDSYRSNEHWLIKTNSNGNEIWSKTYGYGDGYCVKKTTDGGYIATGNNMGLIKKDYNGKIPFVKERWQRYKRE